MKILIPSDSITLEATNGSYTKFKIPKNYELLSNLAYVKLKHKLVQKLLDFDCI